MCVPMTDSDLEVFIRNVESAHTDYTKFGKNPVDLQKINIAAQELERATAEAILEIKL